MANRDYSLDDKIVTAAFQEFLENGFEKASLRKIAANAGVTIGAIHTRWRTKDLLFASLIEPLLLDIQTAFQAIKKDYFGSHPDFSPEHMLDAKQKESEIILHLLFDHYDQAVLLLCRSTGSHLENCFDQIVERKIEESAVFFEQSDFPHPDKGLLSLLIHSEFHMYFQIIEGGYDLNTAKKMMDAAMIYHTGGWLSLFQSYSHEQ